MPDNLYFREPSTQTLLLDILFIWAKSNPDIGYRQGMHEILAVVLWVIERDAIDPDSIQGRGKGQRQGLMESVFEARFIEHDTFTLFRLIMQNAKSAYENQRPPAFSTPKKAKKASEDDAPMVLRSKRIIEEYLAMTDPQLADHLTEIEIIPQVFLL
jgi:TBC1 domain family protein 5